MITLFVSSAFSFMLQPPTTQHPRVVVPTMAFSWDAFIQSLNPVATRAEKERLDGVSACVDEGRITEEESEAINALVGRGASLYGEITPRGFSKLGKRLDLGPTDHFADLGSGVGRIVVQAVTEFDVATSHGVEISASRHDLATKGLQQELRPEVYSRISYSLADACASSEWSEGGGLHDCTVLWTCSSVFGRRTMLLLRERIAASQCVRLVASANTFPDGIEGFTEIAPPEMCEVSWKLHPHPGASVHIYQRN
jgi:hypothetical protein